ncbi:hypothetical protein HDU93_004600, partial [Gonapodya sp. JEL0774]
MDDASRTLLAIDCRATAQTPLAIAGRSPFLDHPGVLHVIPTNLVKFLDYTSAARLARTSTRVRYAVGDLRKWASVLPIVVSVERCQHLLKFLN